MIHGWSAFGGADHGILAPAGLSAHAQAYPAGPVKFITQLAAGGGTDPAMRIVVDQRNGGRVIRAANIKPEARADRYSSTPSVVQLLGGRPGEYLTTQAATHLRLRSRICATLAPVYDRYSRG
jgi:hypothetical protein